MFLKNTSKRFVFFTVFAIGIIFILTDYKNLQRTSQSGQNRVEKIFAEIEFHNNGSDASPCSQDGILPCRSQEQDNMKELASKVRVLCWIMTQPNNHESRAKHVKATWGKRCNILFFVSTVENDTLPSIAYNGNESRSILWGKTKLGFQYAYDHYKDEADWFVKADDDTYIIVENLRYMLHAHDPLQPIWFGCKFKPYVTQGYMSGGAGYVLSRGALDKFINHALTDEKGTVCRPDDDGAEDVEIGKCLENANVTAGDSRDEQGRARFFALIPDHIVVPGSKGP